MNRSRGCTNEIGNRGAVSTRRGRDRLRCPRWETAHARRTGARFCACSMAARIRILRRRLGVCPGTYQQARTGNRSEGHRGQQFRVVAAGRAAHRRRPRKNRIRIRRGNALCETAASPPPSCSRGIFEHEMLRIPAGARRGASGFFQRQEKFVPQEGLCVLPASAFQRRASICAMLLEESRRSRSVTRGQRAVRRGSRPQFVPGICRHRAPPCSRCRPR